MGASRFINNFDVRGLSNFACPENTLQTVQSVEDAVGELTHLNNENRTSGGHKPSAGSGCSVDFFGHPGQLRSNRSRFITLFHALMKSPMNFS